MRNFTSINQKALSYLSKKHNVKIDFNAGAIFDYLKGMILSQSHKVIQSRKEINGLLFTKVYYSKVLEDMPMLGLKTSRSIKDKINTGVEIGLFIKHQAKEEGNVLYFALTELGYEVLENSLTDESEIDRLITGGKAGNVVANNQSTKQKQKPKTPKQEQAFRDMLTRVQSKIKRKTKANFTRKAFNLFKESGLSLDEVERNYIAHVNQKDNFAKTIANFLLDYNVCVEDLSENHIQECKNAQSNFRLSKSDLQYLQMNMATIEEIANENFVTVEEVINALPTNLRNMVNVVDTEIIDTRLVS
jgi:DNA-binding PadR family transcriptional regulator